MKHLEINLLEMYLSKRTTPDHFTKSVAELCPGCFFPAFGFNPCCCSIFAHAHSQCNNISLNMLYMHHHYSKPQHKQLYMHTYPFTHTHIYTMHLYSLYEKSSTWPLANNRNTSHMIHSFATFPFRKLLHNGVSFRTPSLKHSVNNLLTVSETY